MADAGAERRPVEQRGRQHVQRVEPAPGLPHVLDDEVARVVAVEPFAVLEGVVHLRERHRTGLEPAVKDLGNPPHDRSPGRVVRVRPRQLVDRGPVQVGRADAEVPLELVERPVHVDPRVVRVVAHPDRDRGAPEPVPADRPVAGVRQPLAELPVLDVPGHPGDLLVQLDHAVPEPGHLDEPAGHGLVDERVTASPAMRVGVRVVVAADQRPVGAQPRDDRLVRLEDVQAGPIGDDGQILALLVDGEHDRDARRGARVGVRLAVGRGHVDHAGAVLGGHLIGRDDAEGAGGPEPVGVGQVVEQRPVATAKQLASAERADVLRARQLLLVAGQPVVGEDVPLAVRRLHHVVGDVRADRDGQVRRQRPRRGGPGQDPLAGLKLEPDRDRRVGPVGVDVVVHPQLVVGQRGLAPPAVGQHLEALVDQALVVQPLERPQDALHVGEVEGLVVVLEVNPAGLPGDVLLPLLGVAEHRVAARLVEGVDPHLEDVVLAGDAEQPLGFDLGRQAVAVPAEPAVNLAARHRLVTRHDVLDVAGQQVPVVR